MSSAAASLGGWRPGAIPIRVGIIGLGNVGLGHHVPALLAIGDVARVVAVADPSAERRELAVAALGWRRCACIWLANLHCRQKRAGQRKLTAGRLVR